jgi:hypothetical protein
MKLRAIALLAATLFVPSVPAAESSVAAEADTLEYQVKAAYLAKFGNYVDWPDAAAKPSAAGLCIAGNDPFGDTLDRAVAGQSISGRPIVVKRLPTVTRGSDCQILYIGGSPAQSISQALNAVRGETVLTVTDRSAAADGGGIIQFEIKDNKVRFDVDVAAASANGLVVSSKLLNLALTVVSGK